jgi:hypothetical protein
MKIINEMIMLFITTRSYIQTFNKIFRVLFWGLSEYLMSIIPSNGRWVVVRPIMAKA